MADLITDLAVDLAASIRRTMEQRRTDICQYEDWIAESKRHLADESARLTEVEIFLEGRDV